MTTEPLNMREEEAFLPLNKLRLQVMEMHPKGKPLTADGMEYPSPIPLEPPLGYRRAPTLSEQIRDQIKLAKLIQESQENEMETFEEADDFDIGDDYDPTSPYEADFDPLPEDVRAALQSRGRDIDGILGKHTQPEPTPPPSPGKKKKSSPDQGDTDTEDA